MTLKLTAANANEAEEAARALRDRAAYLKGYTYNSTMAPALLRMAEEIDRQVKNA